MLIQIGPACEHAWKEKAANVALRWPGGLVPGSAVWKVLSCGREAVDGRVVAERVADVADDRRPEL